MTLVHPATLCNTLQHVFTMQHTTIHSVTHSATHCNTHCIMHCNMHCNTHCNTHCNKLEHMMQVVEVYVACVHIHIAGSCSLCCMLPGMSVTHCSTNMHIRVYLYIYIYICLCVYIYTCVCLYTCMYARINSCTYRHTYQ